AKAAAEKAAAEKAAAEKAAAAKAAAEKAAAEKAAAEKAAAEKAAAEKAAAEKAAAEKAAAEKAAAEKAAAEKAAAEKAAAEKAAAEKAAAEKERLQKIEANRLALNKKAKDAGLSAEQAAAYAEANKEAQAKAAQEALNSIVAENTRIATKKSELVVKAQVAGLNTERAKQFSDNNVNTAETSIAKALNAEVSKAVLADKGGVYAKGLTTDNQVTSQSSSSQYIQTPSGSRYTTQTTTESSLKKTYDQPYSVVIGSGTMTTTTDNYNGTQTSSNFGLEKVAGLATLEQNVPSVGKAMYTGQAFSSIDNNADFSYLVDFDKRNGSGEITGWEGEFGDIKLKEASLKKVNVGGKAAVGVSGVWSGITDENAAELSESKGNYTLGLFGPKAEEVAGTATVNSVTAESFTDVKAGSNYVVGFGGQKDAKALLKRQAIEAGLTEKRAQAYAETNVNKATADEALKAAVKTQADDLAKIVATGTAIGLTDTHAQLVATAQLDAPKSELKEALQNAALTQATEVKIAAFGNDLAQYYGGTRKINEDSLNDKDQYSLREGWNYIYQQPYSMVVGTWLTTDIKDDVNQLTNGSTYNVDVAGFSTQAASLPSVGKATYTGLGVYTNDRFDLTYNVDFAKRTGSGSLLKAPEYGGKISLDEGKIAKINLKGNNVIGISSSAKALNGTLGKYNLGFYGTEAQEIAGSLEMNQGSYWKNVNGKTEIGLGATRDEISK
ncbi:factor H binding family protein, partial [Psychrobacter sp. Ps2]|uniref:factor H binding family protein n=1 Tax=Psychrobacter sp. Ps2 TaxID=2790956 RepID=UPI001EDE9E7B